MSRFSGPQGKGAMKTYRKIKTIQAKERQILERSRDESRRIEWARDQRAEEQLLQEIFGTSGPSEQR